MKRGARSFVLINESMNASHGLRLNNLSRLMKNNDESQPKYYSLKLEDQAHDMRHFLSASAI